jgi:hypothetical protein
MSQEAIRETNRVFEEEVVGRRNFGALEGSTRATPASCRRTRRP